MPHWKTLFNKDYLGHWDLEKDATVTISAAKSIELVQQGGKKDTKAVLTLEGTKKKFIANTTNCNTIEGMYGADYVGWIGKKITLYATETSVGGVMKGCIRVRPQAPK